MNSSGVCAVALLLALAACKKDESKTPQESPAPSAASAKSVAVGRMRYQVGSQGKLSITIDAPLEKFQGDVVGTSGVIDLDPGNLKASGGEISADLATLATHTFGDKEKDTAQTEHAHNWLELGSDVKPETREDYRRARFTIETIDSASAPSIDAAPESGGVRTVTLKVTGSLRLHGRSSRKTTTVEVAFRGPPSAPTEMTLRTREPLMVSLSEHDVRPRDIAGKFLAGALEKVGKKIDDAAQVSVEASARPGG